MGLDLPHSIDHSITESSPARPHAHPHTPHAVRLCRQGSQGGGMVGHMADARPGRIWFGKIVHPGRLVSYFVILVIDFVTALFNLGV